MPNMNTYTHDYKVLNNKPNESGIDSCNCHNKDTCSLPNSCETKCVIYQVNTDCDIAEYKQKCYLGSCETLFKKIVSEIIKSCSTTLNIKMILLEGTMEYQKWHGKLSEYVVFTIQTVRLV